MSIVVLSSQKPPGRHRGWLTATALLLVSIGLAASTTFQRTSRALGNAIEPPDWGIVFRPPRGFEPTDPARLEHPTRIAFFETLEDGTRAEIAIERIRRPTPDARAVCEFILTRQMPIFGRLFADRLGPPEVMRIGGQEAVEMKHPGAGIFVRAATLQNGESLAVTLQIDRATPMLARLYQLFDLACRSTVFVEPTQRGAQAQSHAEPI